MEAAISESDCPPPLAKAILEKQNAYLSVESENGYNVFIIKYLK